MDNMLSMLITSQKTGNSQKVAVIKESPSWCYLLVLVAFLIVMTLNDINGLTICSAASNTYESLERGSKNYSFQ